ncbi:HipA family kinase [Listeria valentina]|uniref:HipA family kinase n=1 Tax=Listeria valentina TaxID=2705293 RepID=UPI001431BE9A|nr:HipA family kinase [Listeria valentina]
MGSTSGVVTLLTISNVRNGVGNGITKPHYAIINNELCIIKGMNNPEKHLVLFNEYVGYRLAAILGLSVPEFGFAKINQETHFDESGKRKYFTNGCLCFFTKYVEKTVPLRAAKQLQSASSYELVSIFLYDLLICNSDRNPGNLLLHKPKTQNLSIYPIDYTHAFELQAVWDGGQLKRFVEKPKEKVDLDKIDNQLLYQYIKEAKIYRIEEIDECVNHFKNSLSTVNLEEVISEIPKELLCKIEKIDIEYFLRFLESRIEELDQLKDYMKSKIIGGDQL